MAAKPRSYTRKQRERQVSGFLRAFASSREKKGSREAAKNAKGNYPPPICQILYAS
jgi:hypothetical protein